MSTQTQIYPKEQAKARRKWFWQSNKLSKPPYLWDYKDKVYRRIPYEKLHTNVEGVYYVDVKDPPELTMLAVGNPRYFDRIETVDFWVLRRKPRSWFSCWFGHMTWSLGLAVAFNVVVALFNVALTVLKSLGH